MAEFRFDGDRLKNRRIALGLKPEAIALRLDMSKERYIDYENGRAKPPIQRVLDLCSVLKCAPEDLLPPRVDGDQTPDALSHS